MNISVSLFIKLRIKNDISSKKIASYDKNNSIKSLDSITKSKTL